MKRAVVTGLSLLTPLGLGREETWEGILRNESAVGPLTRFDAGDVRAAAQLPDDADELARSHLKPRAARQMTPVTRLAVAAGRRAAEHAGLEPGAVPPERMAVAFGATGTGYALDAQQKDLGALQGFRILKNMPSAAPAYLAMALDARGPGFATSSACSSSAAALAQGLDLIRAGRADAVLAGGADASVNPADVQGFAELLALSTRPCPPAEASCPFDRRRDGFVIGEAAVFLVLEERDAALRRGALPLAELAGASLVTEAYNILSPRPGGEGMARAMAAALEDASARPGDVDYVNAHGTSTPLNDRLETAALKAVFGARAPRIPVSSTKSQLGHTLAAAGALEAAVTVLALQRGTVPPTANYLEPDPDCDLDYVPEGPRRQPLRCALSNAFAFGGHNVCLLFRSPD